MSRSERWNRTASTLEMIEMIGRRMQGDAGQIQKFIDMLNERPDFETRAEVILKALEEKFAMLHAFFKAVREVYAKLPETA